MRVQHGEDLIFVRQVAGRATPYASRTITIYDRFPAVMLRRILHARSGVKAARGWEMREATLFTVETGQLARMERVVLGASLRPTIQPGRGRCRRA